MSGSTSALSQSLGVVWLVWGGTRIDVDSKGSSFNRGGSVASPVVAGNKISQALQTVPSAISAKFPLLKGMSLDALKALNGTEMQIHCDTGQVYIIDSCFFKGDPKTAAGPGSNVSAEWSGSPASEVVS